jgi:four helix bundle protein
MRPHQSLKVFRRSQAALSQVYEVCKQLPIEERYVLSVQLRRAALSAKTNIIEGSKRRTDADFAHFLNIAEASAAEARGLLQDTVRLGFDRTGLADVLQREYAEIELMLRALQKTVLR